MVVFGVLTAAIGLYLWHRQGPHFGLGSAKGKVDRKAAFVSALLLSAIVGAELLVNSK